MTSTPRLVTLLLRTLPLPKRVLLVIDDSPTKRYGPKVEGADVHHNPTPGPADQPFLYGHVWVTISLALRHPEWGPWADLNLGRICDWELTVRIDGGKFLRALPCFQTAPFDEERRDRLRFVSETELHLQSATTRVGCYGEDPTKSLVMELEGKPDSILTVQLTSPTAQTVSAKLSDLIDDNRIEFTGVFTSESFILSRLLSPSEYTATLRWHDQRNNPAGTDWYYIRVTQHNAQMAWSSPIWVG